MALTGKIEADVEVKVPADKFYRIIRSEIHRMPNVSSDKVHAVDVHEGDWEADGCVKLWKYNVEGKVETLKEKIIADDANLCATFVGLEGHIMEEFKSYKAIFRVTPKNDQYCSLVKVTLDFEKVNETIPDPNRYLQWLVGFSKDIEAHLLKA